MTPVVRWQTFNTIALVVAGAILTALAVTWWRDRAHHFADPRWEPRQFVAIEPESADLAGADERWLVAVNLDCSHCQEHLLQLGQRVAGRAHRPALGAILVDQPTRPEHVDLGLRLTAGAWWDSSQVWREKWGRRVYGETFRFDRHGKLLSSTPAGIVPDSSTTLM